MNVEVGDFSRRRTACMRMPSSQRFRDVCLCVLTVTLKFRSMISCCVLAISYNAPLLSPCATWNSDAIIFIANSTGSSHPTGILVTVDDIVYVSMPDLQQVQVWTEETSTPTMNRSINASAPNAAFVTINRDIYVDGGNFQDRVDKWVWNATVSIPVMHKSGACFGLFVDLMDKLYCSLEAPHQVVRRSPNEAVNNTAIVAGNGTSGFASNMLFGPRGLFVDTNFDLYVADALNNRVQRFSPNNSNGITVAGSGAPGTISLSVPHDVKLDGNGYMYIAEHSGHRVVASGPYGFRCIIGCTGTNGLAANQLNNPAGLSFDSHGNLFVSDYSNNRVQKFMLSNKSCGENEILCLS